VGADALEGRKTHGKAIKHTPPKSPQIRRNQREKKPDRGEMRARDCRAQANKAVQKKVKKARQFPPSGKQCAVNLRATTQGRERVHYKKSTRRRKLPARDLDQLGRAGAVVRKDARQSRLHEKSNARPMGINGWGQSSKTIQTSHSQPQRNRAS